MSDIVNGAKSIRMALQYFLSVLSDSVQDDDSRIRVSRLYEPWTAGKYEAGDIRNAEDPDIKPGSAAWFTFWRPLHGKSPETARPFVPVQGAHDMYHAGEYAVYNDALYRCVQDTAYSPEDYSPAWEAIT